MVTITAPFDEGDRRPIARASTIRTGSIRRRALAKRKSWGAVGSPVAAPMLIATAATSEIRADP